MACSFIAPTCLQHFIAAMHVGMLTWVQQGASKCLQIYNYRDMALRKLRVHMCLKTSWANAQAHTTKYSNTKPAIKDSPNHTSLASSPGPFPAFQCFTLKCRRAWYAKSRDGERRSTTPHGLKVTRLVSTIAHK